MARPNDSVPEKQKHFQREVRNKSVRKLRARQEGNHSIWFGLGMSGLVGWSVAIPTLLGIAIGVWIDTRFPSRYSWTLMLLFVGVILGSLNAWYWIRRERQED